MASSSDFSKYLAEAVGTFVLVFTIGCNVLGGTGVWAVTSIAFALMLGVYTLGEVSGAHLNPAVTASIFLSGKLEGGAKTAVMYAASQVAGGGLAALAYTLLFGASFDLGPGKGHSWLVAALVELLYTCMLCFVVLNVACASASKGNQYFGLAIGSVIIAGGYAVGAVSGAAFNPAVAIAIDVSSADKSFGMCAIYVAAQLCGAALAAALFKMVRPEEGGNAGEARSSQAQLAAEFIGTYFLTLTVGCNVLKASAAGAWSAGACLAAMIYAVGSVSGGHLNPAVTLGVLLTKRNDFQMDQAVKHWGAQFLGGICGALTYAGLLGMSLPLNAGLSWGKTTTAEVLFTALLVFTVLSVATRNGAAASKDLFGFIIGAVVTSAGFAGAAFGVCLNPAVAVGIDVSNAVKGGAFGHSVLFGAMEAAGAGAAAGLFTTLYAADGAGKAK